MVKKAKTKTKTRKPDGPELTRAKADAAQLRRLNAAQRTVTALARKVRTAQDNANAALTGLGNYLAVNYGSRAVASGDASDYEQTIADLRREVSALHVELRRARERSGDEIPV